MIEKIAELDLRLDVGALNNMPAKKMKKVFSGVSGIEPQELGDIVKRMLDELALKRLPIGLYTLRIHSFDCLNKRHCWIGSGISCYVAVEFYFWQSLYN